MKSAEPPAEIVAALVWDVPLLRAGSASAQSFATALPGELEQGHELNEVQEDTLGLAAQAVARERANELRDAASLYQRLAEQEGPWTRLLGLMLRSWSASEEGLEAIIAAQTQLEKIEPAPALTARLLAKLATYAFDEGSAEIGKGLLAEAIELAPKQTRLRYVLSVEGLSAGLPSEWPTHDPLLPPDPLVDYPWIHYDSLDAAQAALTAAVETGSRRLWTSTIQFGGRTPLDRAVAAEVQATWAGALWIRRPIRKQLGAQLLTGEARTPMQWGYGVVMWALGAGAKPERIYALAEPQLDQVSTDFIVRTLGEAEIATRYEHRFLSVAVEAWDAISDDVFRWVIAKVEPAEGEHPTSRQAQRIWAGYAARLPDEWFSRFKDQSNAVRVSLLEMMGTDNVKDFSDEVRRAVFETARDVLLERPTIDTQVLRLLAVTAPSGLDDAIREAVQEKASATAVTHLAFEGHGDLLTEQAIAAARTKLISGVRKENEEARQGRISLGPEDVRWNLGRLVAGGSGKDPEAVALLMEIAVDSSLPSRHLLYARHGLMLIRRAERLEPSNIQALHDAEDPVGTFAEHHDVSPDLLRIARLQVLALDLTPKEVATLVAACRAQDAKVRQLAVVTCAEAVHAQADAADDALAWALIGGLFDPVDEVVASALGSFDLNLVNRYPAVGQVALERLPRLQKEGSVPVRAIVSALATKWRHEGPLIEDPVVHTLFIRGQQDRSWIVRNSRAS